MTLADWSYDHRINCLYVVFKSRCFLDLWSLPRSLEIGGAAGIAWRVTPSANRPTFDRYMIGCIFAGFLPAFGELGE